MTLENVKRKYTKKIKPPIKNFSIKRGVFKIIFN
jgi:hypothetical protein